MSESIDITLLNILTFRLIIFHNGCLMIKMTNFYLGSLYIMILA